MDSRLRVNDGNIRWTYDGQEIEQYCEMNADRQVRLKASLDQLYNSTDFEARIQHDPIAFPKRFSDPQDVEIVGWLASGLAYGRVSLFQAALEKILRLMGPSPRDFVANFDPSKHAEDFLPLYYRMNRGEDIACFLYLVRRITEKHGSIGRLFISLYDDRDQDIGPTLERFIRAVQRMDTSEVYGRNIHPPGLTRFFALPSKGSSCKRLNLFLRWMVRPNDGLDFGLWREIQPSKLIIPLDTHILRISRYLGLTRRKGPSWATAKAITASLRRLDPDDPLRYDFPICHHGISGACPIGREPERCRVCSLRFECTKGRALTRQDGSAFKFSTMSLH